MAKYDMKYGKFFRITADPTGHKKRALGTIYCREKKVHQLEGETMDKTIDKCKQIVDAFNAERKSKRRIIYIPSKEEFVDALKRVEIDDQMRTILEAHANAPKMTMTTEDIAKAAGWPHHSIAGLHIEKWAEKLSEELDAEPTVKNSDGSNVWASIYNTATHLPSGVWKWEMYPEFAEALEELNII